MIKRYLIALGALLLAAIPAGADFGINQLHGFNAFCTPNLTTSTQTSDGTFVVPDCVYTITVELIGGGGGASNTGGSAGSGGGGGGAYCKETISVTPGASHSFDVGVGGPASTNGSPSIFYATDGTTELARANAGTKGAAGNVPGAAGATTAECDTAFAGGTGGGNSTVQTNGNGGGGGAGSTSAGGSGGLTGTTAGTAGTGTLADGTAAGAGGAGSVSGAGNVGNIYGGGAGGASNGGHPGVAGAQGIIVFSYGGSG
jgi:hypothetical protein